MLEHNQQMLSQSFGSRVGISGHERFQFFFQRNCFKMRLEIVLTQFSWSQILAFSTNNTKAKQVCVCVCVCVCIKQSQCIDSHAPGLSEMSVLVFFGISINFLGNFYKDFVTNIKPTEAVSWQRKIRRLCLTMRQNPAAVWGRKLYVVSVACKCSQRVSLRV